MDIALQEEALGTSTSVADVVRPLDQAERIDITVLESEFAGTGKAPAELQGEFVALHDQFTTVVDHALNGSLKGDTLDSATGDLEFQYNELIASNFRSQLLFGVKASLVIVFFGEIDANLVRATTEAGSGKSAKAVVFLKLAQTDKQSIENISPRRAGSLNTASSAQFETRDSPRSHAELADLRRRAAGRRRPTPMSATAPTRELTRRDRSERRFATAPERLLHR